MPERGQQFSLAAWPRFLRWLRRGRFRVADRSMAPTLEPGDCLYVDRRAYRDHAPAPGDLVVARDPTLPSRLLVKRVAESPTPPTTTSSTRQVYLLGDEPIGSHDSRHFGPVPRDSVVGRVYRCYHPPERRRDL